MSRFRLRIIAVLAVACMAAMAAMPTAMAQHIAAPSIQSETHVLGNGLRLVMLEDHSTPIVAINLWYHVGSKNEKVGRTGFAHLFEHMMFQGSKNHDTDFFKALEPLGATDLNGTTNSDRTNYFENVPSHALEAALWLEADRMGWLLDSMTQERLDNQREVVKNERRQSYENQPYGLVNERMYEALYPKHHPYSWPVIGSMEDLGAASKEDVEAFFKTHYSPNNCTLVVAGDIDKARTRALVEKYFGEIPPGPPVYQPQAWVPTVEQEIRLGMEDRVPLPRLYLAWHVPGWYQDGEADLEMLSGILAQGKNSRLYKRLVYELQIAQDVRATVESRQLSGLFRIIVTAKEGHTLDQIEPIVLEEVEKLRRTAVTAKDVERVRTTTLAGYVRGMDRIGGFGGKSDILGRYATYTGTPDYIEKDFARYHAVTPASVKAAAERWLHSGRVVMQVTPFADLDAAPQVASLDRSKMPALGTAAPLALPGMERTTLSNGLQVVLARSTKVPAVRFNMIVRGGWSSDAQEQRGLASFTAGMLDEGTRTRSSMQIAEEAEMLGAQIGTGSGLDTWNVSLSTLKARLQPSLELWADVLLNPSFPDEELERQRKQALGRILQEKKQPVGMAIRILPALLYGEDHPYGQPFSGSGTEATIRAIKRNDMVKAHGDWFKPNNAVVVVVGDTNMKEIVPLLEKSFSGWSKGELPSTLIGQREQPKQTTVYLIDKPGAAQSVLLAGSLAPPKNNPDDVSFEVLNTILGGQFTSRLNMNLREDKGYSYGAFTIKLDARAQGAFIGFSQVRTDVTKESMVEMMKELKDIRSERPVTAEEVKQAQDNLTLSLPGQYESLAEVGGMVNNIITFDLPENYYDTYPAAVHQATTAGLTTLAKKRILPDQMVLVVVGDRKLVEDGIRSLNLGPMKYLDADGNLLPEAATVGRK